MEFFLFPNFSAKKKPPDFSGGRGHHCDATKQSGNDASAVRRVKCKVAALWLFFQKVRNGVFNDLCAGDSP